ncbi:MAG: radical SAM protein [Desulfatiglans sp.]|nr:radical SAM protein [Desulfatiglans sp.]
MSKGALRPFIVPIFIPHQGCPHHCVFCEQQKITSHPRRLLGVRQVQDILNRAICSKGFNPNRRPLVAFYGGTFTGLPLSRMQELLGAVSPYLTKKLFYSIRVSTRPDAIDDERLRLMKEAGVDTVELGVQSMDNHVLELSERGHSVEDSVRAVRRIKKHGLKVGIQLMPGLPGDSPECFRSTVTQVVSLRPDLVRLYPTVVIQGTKLHSLYREGRYRPMTLVEALNICIESCIHFEEKIIKVIRIGLMSSPSLTAKDQIVAGPWHPSFGQMVRSGVYRHTIEPQLPIPGSQADIRILVSKQDVHLLRGYKNEGLAWLQEKTGTPNIRIQLDDSLPTGRIRIERE